MSQAFAQGISNQAPPMPPHGMKGVIEVVPVLPAWLVILAGIILALMVVGILWLFYIRLKNTKKIQKVEIESVDPWEKLLSDVKDICIPDPFVGKPREDYFYLLGMACRRWLEIVYNIEATDLTLHELKSPIMKLGLPDSEKDQILQFLGKGDLVKFAGAEASVTDGQAALNQLNAWLEKWPLRSINRQQGGI